MKVELMTPRKILFSGEAVEVTLPGEDGEMSVLDFHQPCISRLKNGKISVRLTEFKSKNEVPLTFMIKRGMARVGGVTLVVLAEDQLGKAA